MSARVVLAVAVVLAAGPARADQKVAPSDDGPRETMQSSDRGGSDWTKDSSSDSHAYAKDSSSDSREYVKDSSSDSRDYVKDSSSDHAVARSSSDSHKSSSAGQHHASGRSSGGGERHESRPPQTAAQQRHPRPGTGTGHFDNSGRRGNYGSRFYWGSAYYGYGRYGYYYNPYDYWYSPFYYSGYYGYSPSYYRRGRGYGYYRDSGSLRIIVDPEKTRVYVDGYYAGIADDFDGILQRLNVPPGRHDITLKLEGYRTQHFKVYVPVDDTIKIHYDMVRGTGEATSEEFAGPADDYGRVRDMDDEDARRGDDDGRYDRRDPGRDDGRDQGDTGSVRLEVNPRDASVYVDGEFRGSGRQSANLRLRPGRHRIEVVRPGFRTVEREVDVQSGRSTDLQFDLERI
jgi:hypothetical protein